MPCRPKTIFTAVKKGPWIVVFLLLTACLDEPECLRVADNALVFSFTRLSDGEADTVIFMNITAESDGLVPDSVFYKQIIDVRDTLKGTNALVAVNPQAAETLFTFHFEDEDKFVRVGYQSAVRFISEDCGSEVLQTKLTVLETNFDSVRVVNKTLTKARVTNVEVFN